MVYLDQYSRKYSPKPILAGKRRESAIGRVMDLLDDWRWTPFENEAAARHGLRQSFCLKSLGWETADLESASLVADALKAMGITRPSWIEGQRQYVIAVEDCAWCSLPLPAEVREGARRGRFCSSVCASNSLNHRSYESRARYDAVRIIAAGVLRREERESRPCKHCGIDFKPFSHAGNSKVENQSFCSNRCWTASRRTLLDKHCAACSAVFRPTTQDRKFCSPACAVSIVFVRECAVCSCQYESRSKQSRHCSMACNLKASRQRKAEKAGRVYLQSGSTIVKSCEECGSAFIAKTTKAIFCGGTCKARAHRKRTAIIIPFPTISPAVFDQEFAVAA